MEPTAAATTTTEIRRYAGYAERYDAELPGCRTDNGAVISRVCVEWIWMWISTQLELAKIARDLKRERAYLLSFVL